MRLPAILTNSTHHPPGCLQSPLAPTREILAAEGVLPRLVALLGSPTSNVAESAAAVLACYCQGPAEQSAVAAADGVDMLVALLSSEQRSKQEAALEALAALSRGNAVTSQAMLQHGSVVSCLLRAIKHGGTPHTCFVAAVCLANLSRNLPPDHMEHSQQVGCCLAVCLVALLQFGQAITENCLLAACHCSACLPRLLAS